MHKSFVFLYPQPEIFNWELRYKNNEFKRRYEIALNHCIDERYRKKDFTIYYALLDDGMISEVIHRRRNDRIICVGMDSSTHRTEVNGAYPYPNQDFILNQLMPTDLLRVGGFHAFDCCNRLGARAYERGIDVLVDEDLTQFFSLVFQHKDFKCDVYPSVNHRKELAPHSDRLWKHFISRRENKPWYIQNFDF